MRYLILLLIPNLIFANEVKYLKVGDPAPYEGYLFTSDHEKRYRLLDQEQDYQKQINISLTNINKSYQSNETVMQQRIENQQQQISHLNDRLSDSKDGFLSKAAYFVFGAILTGFIAYGVYRTK